MSMFFEMTETKDIFTSCPWLIVQVIDRVQSIEYLA